MAKQLASAPVVKLWTPRLLLLITFFLGFGGILLACVNWIRMGMTNKAIAHLIGGIVGVSALYVFVSFLPGQVGGLIKVFAAVGIATYLHIGMKRDIESYKAANHEVRNANWIFGGLIGLAGFVASVALGIMIGILLILVGIVLPS